MATSFVSKIQAETNGDVPLCQYAWSRNTVPLPEQSWMTPKTNAKLDFKVMYEPFWFPATGRLMAASLRSWYIADGEPIWALVV